MGRFIGLGSVAAAYGWIQIDPSGTVSWGASGVDDAKLFVNGSECAGGTAGQIKPGWANWPQPNTSWTWNLTDGGGLAGKILASIVLVIPAGGLSGKVSADSAGGQYNAAARTTPPAVVPDTTTTPPAFTTGISFLDTLPYAPWSWLAGVGLGAYFWMKKAG